MNILSYLLTKRRIKKFSSRLNAARELGLHIVCLNAYFTRESVIFRMLCLEIGVAQTFNDLYFKIENKEAPPFICNMHGFLRNLEHLSLTERDTELLLMLTEDNTDYFEKKIAKLMISVTYELSMHERNSRARYAEHVTRILQKAFFSDKIHR